MSVQSLKEQLSEKELRVYELELHVNELNAQVKELSVAKDKLLIANRNARTLEEENSNLIMHFKTLEGGPINPAFVPGRTEADKIIKENNELRTSLNELNAAANKTKNGAKSKEAELEKQLRNLSEDRDRMSKERERQVKELDNVRRQCADLQRALDEERDTARAAEELWDQERDRYTQKIDDLLAAAKRAEGLSVASDTLTRERPSDLQTLLLKEEVEQLEKKAKIAEERLWNKEKDWLQTEARLKQELANAGQVGSEGGNDRSVYRVLQDQIAALKLELMQLRGERRQNRPNSITLGRQGSEAPNHGAAGSRGTPSTSSVRVAGAAGPGGRAGGPGGSGDAWLRGVPDSSADGPGSQKTRSLADANVDLRDQLDDLKAEVLEARLTAEEKEVRIKELEVLLATAKAKQAGADTDARGVNGADNRSSGASAASTSRHRDGDVSDAYSYGRPADEKREIAQLRKKIRELEKEVGNTCAAHEQKDTVNKARLQECRGQIEELLQENEDLIQGGAAGNGGAENFLDHFMSVVRLSKDKRDSVEDVMRLLESSWANETDAMREVRNAKMQGAAMATHDATKEDKLRRMQDIIDDLRDQLNAAEGDHNVADDMRDRMRDLERDNAALKKRLRDGEKQNDKNQSALERENDALSDKLRALEERDRAAGSRLGDVQQQLRNVREENNKLRRQMARSPRDWSASNRSPQRALSQLSVRSSDERKRSAIPEGAHLAVTVVELSDVLRNGIPITEPGYIIIKLKSIKEKYKTSVKELSSVIRFDESFEFYLAQPDQDVITLHVFYRLKDSTREYHIGDACFSMATLYRGVPRQRIAPAAQNPGLKDARRAAQIEVILQTDDFGRMTRPTEAEVEDETLRFNEMVNQCESSAPDKLHAVDVYMASRELM